MVLCGEPLARHLSSSKAKPMAASDHRNAWDRWYSTKRWQKLRTRQLQDHPLCRMCAARGLVEPARVVDHVEPHKGNWTSFVTGRLQSLCKTCHDSSKRIVEL